MCTVDDDESLKIFGNLFINHLLSASSLFNLHAWQFFAQPLFTSSLALDYQKY